MDQFEKACEDVNKEYENDGMVVNENCIEWIRGSTIATISIVQGRLKSKIRKYAEEYPDLFQIVSERDGVIVAHIPTKSIRITHVTPRELSEEKREAARERLAAYREEKRLRQEAETADKDAFGEDEEGQRNT